MNSTAQPKSAAKTCDLCHDDILPEERFTDEGEGGEVYHDACANDWFRRNFGREGLS